MSESLLSKERKCWVCGNTRALHKHHIYMGPNRTQSEYWGCWVYLCPEHHNKSNKGVHSNHDLDVILKKTCQREWEKKNGSTERFRAIFGRSYL